MEDSLKKRLLGLGYTVIGDTYTKDNKFACILFDKFSGYHLSGANKPNSSTGTGCNYKIGYEFSNHDFEAALNYSFVEFNPPFYNDINDYLINHFSTFSLMVENPYNIKSPFELLEGYFIFISDKYKRIIVKNHISAVKYYDSKKYYDNHKAIFQIVNGDLIAVNHNINLFGDFSVMEDFKNRIKKG
jgi:hypothetical protein